MTLVIGFVSPGQLGEVPIAGGSPYLVTGITGAAPPTPAADGVCIGDSTANTVGNSSVAVGYGTDGSASSSVAIGLSASASSSYGANNAVAVGAYTNAEANGAVCVGNGAVARTVNSIAIGNGAFVNGIYTNSIAIGYNVNSTASNQMAIGTTTTPLTIAFVASGVQPTDAVNVSQITPASAITGTPAKVGLFAVVAGIGYMSIGTASAADWHQITN